MDSLREQLFDYISSRYKTLPEYPWKRFPGYAVFRHKDNQKLFALVTEVQRGSAGFSGSGKAEVLNLKMKDPFLADLLSRQKGYARGVHFTRGSWIAVCLDGTVSFEEIRRWLEESYRTTASGETRKKLRPPKAWLIPANPKYYDVVKAFSLHEEIHWKQGKGIKEGDVVFLYVASPVSAILYRCTVTKTEIPALAGGEQPRIGCLMRIRRTKAYPSDRFTFETLGKTYGIRAVRGPRGIQQKLIEALNGD